MNIKSWLLAAFTLASTPLWAQEEVRVISSTALQVSPPSQTAYLVVYEQAGQQYTVQLPYEPGPTLQVSPVSTLTDARSLPQAALASVPAWPSPMPPTTVYMVSPPTSATYVYPYPSPYYYVPPVSLHLGVGYYRGYGYGHGHRWR